jgi:hypothetical protein
MGECVYHRPDNIVVGQSLKKKRNPTLSHCLHPFIGHKLFYYQKGTKGEASLRRAL